MSTSDTVTTIAEGLAESPVHVDPGVGGLPTDRAEALEATIIDNDLPIFVVATPVDHADEFGGRPGQLLALVHERTGTDGIYVHSDGDRLEVRAWNVDEPWEAASLASDEPTAADDLDRFVELVISGEAPGLLNQEMYGDVDESGGLSGGVITLIVVLVLAAVIATVSVVLRRTQQAVGQQRRAFDVPEYVVESVRHARLAAVEKQARTVTLELGEAIDATAVPADGGALTEYRLALDTYDAAGRVLDRSRGIADAVGALVLAESGRLHLGRATGSAAHRKPAPPTPCFFNPLHGASVREVALPGQTGSKVPACADCARAVKQKGGRPEALMVTVDGSEVPYYESGIEPWASTGYGSIDADLIERVLTRGIGR